MPAKDIFHNTVRLALEKDGWLITKDPLYIKVGGSEMYIDLAAEQLIAAQKDNQSIAVEIKSFLQESEMAEFHVALGQCLDAVAHGGNPQDRAASLPKLSISIKANIT
ncbi:MULTISPECIES: element excision factor XisH family protein [unclassified Moorena]|uniref:element excision factor XisH family protein n=1 Tax=unclassified Moorena TaxID=2683338 RepID=UPI0026A86397